MTWWISSPFFSSIISLLFFFFFFSRRNLFTNNNSLLTLLFQSQSGDKSVTIQVFTLYAKKIRWTDKVNIFFSRIPRLPRFTFRRQVQINLDAIVEIELVSWKKKKERLCNKEKEEGKRNRPWFNIAKQIFEANPENIKAISSRYLCCLWNFQPVFASSERR